MSGSPLQRRMQCLYWWNELPRRELGFSECLGTTALAWAINTSSMYIAWNHAIKVPFQLQTSWKRVNQKALLDSSAMECFIHPRVVAWLQLSKWKLDKPQKVQNVDRAANKDREILEVVDLLVNNNGKSATHAFFVANIGQDVSWTAPFLYLTWLLEMVTWHYISTSIFFISSVIFYLLPLCSSRFCCLLSHSIYIYKDFLEHSSSFWLCCIYTALVS